MQSCLCFYQKKKKNKDKEEEIPAKVILSRADITDDVIVSRIEEKLLKKVGISEFNDAYVLKWVCMTLFCCVHDCKYKKKYFIDL